MSTLTDFLLARIAEDERRYSADPSEYGYGHAFRMAECEAKRRIVTEVLGNPMGKWRGGEVSPWAMKMLGLLALPYADHPDYRDEWTCVINHALEP